jgi:hypothetical protein
MFLPETYAPCGFHADPSLWIPKHKKDKGRFSRWRSTRSCGSSVKKNLIAHARKAKREHSVGHRLLQYIHQRRARGCVGNRLPFLVCVRDCCRGGTLPNPSATHSSFSDAAQSVI